MQFENGHCEPVTTDRKTVFDILELFLPGVTVCAVRRHRPHLGTQRQEALRGDWDSGKYHKKDLCLKFLKFQFCYINSSCARDSSPRPAGPYWLDLQEDSLSPAARQTEDSQNPGRG